MSAQGRTPEEVAPDPRIAFADERTFLAWSRTGLALIGGGVAIVCLTGGGIGPLAGIPLIAFGAFLGLARYQCSQRNEQALRRGEPLPATQLPRDLTYGVFVAAVAAANTQRAWQPPIRTTPCWKRSRRARTGSSPASTRARRGWT
jgi:putative membrane protein